MFSSVSGMFPMCDVTLGCTMYVLVYVSDQCLLQFISYQLSVAALDNEEIRCKCLGLGLSFRVL